MQRARTQLALARLLPVLLVTLCSAAATAAGTGQVSAPALYLFDNAPPGAPLVHLPPRDGAALRGADLGAVLGRLLGVGSPTPPATGRALPAADAFRTAAANVLVAVDAPAGAGAPSGAAAFGPAGGAAFDHIAAAGDAMGEAGAAVAWLPAAVSHARGAGAVMCAAVERDACAGAPPGATVVHWDDSARSFLRSDTGSHWLSMDEAVDVLRAREDLASGLGGLGIGLGHGMDELDAESRRYTMELAMMHSLHRLLPARGGGAGGVAPAPAGGPRLLLVHVRQARALAARSSAAAMALSAAVARGMCNSVGNTVGAGLVAGQVVAADLPVSSLHSHTAHAPASFSRRLAEQVDGPSAAYSPVPEYKPANAANVRYANATCLDRATKATFDDAETQASCPPLTSEIAQTEILIWTTLGLIGVLFLAVSALFGMDVGKDPLLYARFSVAASVQ